MVKEVSVSLLAVSPLLCDMVVQKQRLLTAPQFWVSHMGLDGESGNIGTPTWRMNSPTTPKPEVLPTRSLLGASFQEAQLLCPNPPERPTLQSQSRPRKTSLPFLDWETHSHHHLPLAPSSHSSVRRQLPRRPTPGAAPSPHSPPLGGRNAHLLDGELHVGRELQHGFQLFYELQFLLLHHPAAQPPPDAHPDPEPHLLRPLTPENRNAPAAAVRRVWALSANRALPASRAFPESEALWDSGGLTSGRLHEAFLAPPESLPEQPCSSAAPASP